MLKIETMLIIIIPIWFQNYAKYRDGKITGKEFLIALSKDTGKAAAISAGFTGGLVLGTAICKHLATSSSTVARFTGNYLGKLLGPAVLVGALGYQASQMLIILQ